MAQSQGGCKKRRRTPAQKEKCRIRTALNKIERIKKSLETAKGKQVSFLKERLIFWNKYL